MQRTYPRGPCFSRARLCLEYASSAGSYSSSQHNAFHDESLQIDVADDKGLRQGTYLLELGYRTLFSTKSSCCVRQGGSEFHFQYTVVRIH